MSGRVSAQMGIISEDLQSVLFLDIETVPAHGCFSDVPEEMRELWVELYTAKRKTKGVEDGEPFPEDSDYQAAGLRAEFGKIICISLGRFDGGTADENFKVYSIAREEERDTLLKFAEVLQRYDHFKLCAHNGKGFDFPYLGKRFLINGLPLPRQLNVMGLKPWEVPHIDTNELWSFGAKGFGHGAKLKLLCAVFGIPSPKDDLDGSQVCGVYYGEEDGLSRIKDYCEKDVRALACVSEKWPASNASNTHFGCTRRAD